MIGVVGGIPPPIIRSYGMLGHKAAVKYGLLVTCP